MSLIRRSPVWQFTQVMVGVALLLAALAQPAAAPLLAAPMLAAPVPAAPSAPPASCGFNATLVDNLLNGGANSLRGAVACAGPGQTVTFDPIVSGETIHLTTGGVAITQSITIDGSNAPGVIVDAGDISRIFVITASGPVTLTALTLQHGQAPSSNNGGAIVAGPSSPLVLDEIQVLSSTAPSGAGGGVYAASSLTVSNATFISNASVNGGGGVWASSLVAPGGVIFLGNKCTGTDCQGGGLYAQNASVFNFLSLLGNLSAGSGGGAFINASAALTTTDIEDNQCQQVDCAGGGLSVSGSLTLADSDVISNASHAGGGGLAAIGPLVAVNSYLEGNQCFKADCQGGGLATPDSLTLTDTLIYSNTSGGNGGGAAVGGALAATGSYFLGNRCTQADCQGGGLAAYSSVQLNASYFTSNLSLDHGGGAAVGGSVVANGGGFQGNQCSQSACLGGGLAAQGSLTITNTRFVSNTSVGNGGGAMAAGSMTVTGSGFHDNHCTGAGCLGGGLFAVSPALITSSSFQDNEAAGSGGAVGITATTQLTLANDTLSDNDAVTSGAGLYVGGASQARLFNLTLSGNEAPSGAGLFVEPGATVGVSNTILANSVGGANCAGAIAAGTHNLEFPGSACATAGPSAGFTSGDPRLAHLALNPPGITQTNALLPGSAALHAGANAICAAAPVNGVDQRGAPRTNDGEGGPSAACDIGAFEAGPWQLFLPLASR